MDSTSHILNASPAQVVDLMGMGHAPARVWRPQELGAVFRHQMAAPVSVDLAGLGPEVSGKLRTLADASGLLLKNFQDLFQHPDPPVELLELVKQFAKANRGQPESALPTEVATALYYLSIAAALVRLGQRITALSDEDLRRGFLIVIGQEWLDAVSRELLEAAQKQLPGGAAAES